MKKRYMEEEEKMHAKGGKANRLHEAKEGKKKRLAEKLMESRNS